MKLTWDQVCQDRALTDLPYKVELDSHGKLIMSPAHKEHSRLQTKIQRWLIRLLPQGDPLPECAVRTVQGIRVPDVAWISEERWASLAPDEASCSRAPEICVEILSAANSVEEMLGTAERPGKRELYFQAGAQEFWLCDETGRVRFFDTNGQTNRSRLCPEFPEQV